MWFTHFKFAKSNNQCTEKNWIPHETDTNFNTLGHKITILKVEKFPREKNAQAVPYPDGILSQPDITSMQKRAEHVPGDDTCMNGHLAHVLPHARDRRTLALSLSFSLASNCPPRER